MTEIIGLLLSIAGMLIAVLALREVRQIKQNDSLPYWVRNGLEDIMVPLIKSRMAIKRQQEFLDAQDRELDVWLEIAGEIRNGEYDKDQPHKKR